MSEQKHEIPAAMLDAATAAIKELRETRGLGFVVSAEIAKIALEAAGVPALIAERDRHAVHATRSGENIKPLRPDPDTVLVNEGKREWKSESNSQEECA